MQTANPQITGTSHGQQSREAHPGTIAPGPLKIARIDASEQLKRILDDPARAVTEHSVIIPMSGVLSGAPARGRIDRGTGIGRGGGSSGGTASDSPTPANPGSDTTPANGSGAVIAVANVHLLFWGDAWLSSTTQPSMTDVIAAVTTLLSGPFLGDLRQYGVKHAQVADTAVVGLGLNPTPPANITADDALTLVAALIREGLLPTLTNAPEYSEVFGLITPSTPAAPNTWGFGGFHNYGADAQGKNIYFFVVGSAGSITDGITIGVSHELVECCTDPDFNEIKFSNSGENEIADICEDQTGYVNGVHAQKYWSQTEKACVLPTQPNATGPTGSNRVLNLAAKVTINAGGKSAKSATFDVTRVVTVNNNQTSAVAVVTTPAVNTLSANIVLDFTWNADFSVSVSFSSGFFLGLNSVTSYKNSFKLQPGATEFYSVDHEIDNNTDTCTITFNVNNTIAAT